MQEQLGIPCRPASSAEAVVDQCDILTTITSSSRPVFDGGRIRPGTHINAAGGNSLARRELDEACLGRCGSIVVDSKDQARLECGEFLKPIEKGSLRREQVGELGDVVTGRRTPRNSPEEITLFKSLGLAIQDVAVAARVYRLALERKKGAYSRPGWLKRRITRIAHRNALPFPKPTEAADCQSSSGNGIMGSTCQDNRRFHPPPGAKRRTQ